MPVPLPPQHRDLLDHPIISSRYFFPRAGSHPDPVMVRTADGIELVCWRSAPPSDRPVLLHFHGNGELVGDWTELFATELAPVGVDLFLTEYRGYGESTGVPRLASMLDDVSTVVAALRVPPERVVVMGRSVGSIYAIEAVERFPSMGGLVLESGIHDVLQRLLLRLEPHELGVSADQLRAAATACLDHGRKLDAYRGPSLILHAENDFLVTIDHAERNHAAAGGRPKQLVRFAQGNHNTIVFANLERYFAELRRFLGACFDA